MDESDAAVLERPILEATPPETHQLTPREIELRESKTSPLQKIKGSPRIWYVEIDGDGPAIFKSERYSDTQNERAAYLVSRIVGFDFVPPTVLREVGGEKGSLQEMVEDGLSIDEVEDPGMLRDDLYKYWIFGHVIRNMDRHDDNFLVKGGRLISIDHDSSFDPDMSDPANFDLWRKCYGETPAPQLVDMFKHFLEDNPRQQTLRTSLQELLSREDVEITMKRIEVIGNLLIQNGRIDNKEELRI